MLELIRIQIRAEELCLRSVLMLSVYKNISEKRLLDQLSTVYLIRPGRSSAQQRSAHTVLDQIAREDYSFSRNISEVRSHYITTTSNNSKLKDIILDVILSDQSCAYLLAELLDAISGPNGIFPEILETMTEFNDRFSSVVIELTRLGKEYKNQELALKVMRALPKEWMSKLWR
ncbi:hypothetical protein F511_28451 [Dorcoceras hygrometricum]|uniref:Uncharacterized protein n=1 Tax=Dorcoceras hygrometricum TaxID=472368 RepID=A0A2Z7D7V2_9LAMI|nr:hypothetical protein F511_28451 [Dorcoceras hygrometricum]